MAFRQLYTFSQRSGNRANFPIKIHGSRAGSDLWDNIVSRDGGEFRLFDTLGNELPIDVVRFDPGGEDFLIQSRLTLSGSSSTGVYLHFGDSSNQLYAHNATYGRYAVWQDFRHAIAGGYDASDRAGNEADLSPARPTFVRFLKEASRSGSLTGVAQGIVKDWVTGRYIGIQTNKLTLYDSSLVATGTVNNDPAGDAGITSNKHCSAGCIVGNELILPVQNHTNPTSWSTTYLAAFDRTTLAFLRKSADIQANGNSSAVTYNPRDGLLYVTEYLAAGPGKLYKYALEDFSYQSGSDVTITSVGGAATLAKIQGICYKNGNFFVSEDDDKSLKMLTLDGKCHGRYFDVGDTDVYQGCDATPDGIIVAVAQSDESSAVVVFVEANDGFELLTTSQGMLCSDATISTTWTMGGWFTRSSGAGTTMSCLNYGGSDDAERAVAGHRNTNQWGLWNTTDSWLVTGVTVTGSQEYFLAADHDEAGDVRHLYVDSNVYTDSGMTAKPSGTPSTHWNVGSVVNDTQRFIGFGRDCWIRLDKVDTAYNTDLAAAETDLTFYTVGDVEDLTAPGTAAGGRAGRVNRIGRNLKRHVF